MDIVHFSQKQLAARWCVSEATIEHWRSEKIGPKFLKLCGRVLYRQVDIESWKESNTANAVLCPKKRLDAITHEVIDQIERRIELENLFPQSPVNPFATVEGLAASITSMDQIENVVEQPIAQKSPGATIESSRAVLN
jgi:predicted DNA-binding transcriptional regulator AlpA